VYPLAHDLLRGLRAAPFFRRHDPGTEIPVAAGEVPELRGGDSPQGSVGGGGHGRVVPGRISDLRIWS